MSRGAPVLCFFADMLQSGRRGKCSEHHAHTKACRYCIGVVFATFATPTNPKPRGSKVTRKAVRGGEKLWFPGIQNTGYQICSYEVTRKEVRGGGSSGFPESRIPDTRYAHTRN